MKRCVSALLCLSLLVGLCACQSKTMQTKIDTVGSIGETSFSGELYQLLVMNAVQADPQADQKKLRQSVLLEMERYAAIEENFARLGGEMGTEGQAYVDQYTQRIWEQSEETMSAKGIRRETLESYVAHLYRADQMLELFYGENGAQAVSDQEILDYTTENFYYGTCVYLPLTGKEGADIRQDGEAMDAVRGAAQRIQSDILSGTSPEEAAQKELPNILALTGGQLGEQGVQAYVYTNMYTPFNWEASLSQASIERLRAANLGECVVLENSGDITVFLRTDPLESYEIGDMRSYATYYMKQDELEAQLAQQGAEMAHDLDEAAMDAIWSSTAQS